VHKPFHFCDICGCHSSIDEDSIVLGYYAILSGKKLPLLQGAAFGLVDPDFGGSMPFKNGSVCLLVNMV
jgi:hypothetical protein